MILGFSDLELAISDVGSAASYLGYVYESLPSGALPLLKKIIRKLDSVEHDLCELYALVEHDDE